jgi:peptide/nickel transport system substrate-binding protein
VKFTDGEPMNADAVVFSVKVFLKTTGQAAGFLTFIAGAQKVDDLTVDIMTTVPTSELPASLAFLYVFPPNYYNSKTFGDHPIGTGPYKFVSWNKGVDLKVVANPQYWGQKPSIQAITFSWVTDDSTRVAELATGQADLITSIPPELVSRVVSAGDASTMSVQSTRAIYFEMNLHTGPTANVLVRQAINYAVDMNAIIKAIFNGRATPQVGINLPGFVGYQGSQLHPFTYDPTKAKQLLTQAGYPKGFSTDLWYTIGRYVNDQAAAQAIAGYLAAVGITTTQHGMEAGAYFNKVTGGSEVSGISLNSCQPFFLDPLFCASYEFQPGNDSSYGATPQTAQYLAAATSALTPQAKGAIIQQLENYVDNQLVPWLSGWYQDDIYGVSNHVSFTPQSDELIDFVNVHYK